MERRLSAILAADMVGYSRLMEIDEIGTLNRLNEVRARIIDPIVTRSHGRVLGGGGGIALVAGASRLISPRAFLLTIAIAVTLVPLCMAALDRLGLAWSLL